MLVKSVNIPVGDYSIPLLEPVTVDIEDYRALTDSLQHWIGKRIMSKYPNCPGTPLISSCQIGWDGHAEYLSAILGLMDGEDLKNQFLMVKARGFRDVLVVKYDRVGITIPELSAAGQLLAMGTAQLSAVSTQDGEHTATLADLGGGETLVVHNEQTDSVDGADESTMAATEVGDGNPNTDEKNLSSPFCDATHNRNGLAMVRLARLGRLNRVVLGRRVASAPLPLRHSHTDGTPKNADRPPSSQPTIGSLRSPPPTSEVSPEKSEPERQRRVFLKDGWQIAATEDDEK